ncbi:hypothetical protein ACLBSL_33310, partial [Klebsiella pneumoniae]|uniref:hypothetical protein n=1 Tax=Klebsiella pneumoniae TaxID=573 RepID=UPI003968EC7A
SVTNSFWHIVGFIDLLSTFIAFTIHPYLPLINLLIKRAINWDSDNFISNYMFACLFKELGKF